MTFEKTTPPEWSEERLRYRILREIYESTGANCVRTMTACEIGTNLSIAYEDLYRVVNYLAEHEFLFAVGEGPRVCITPRGIRYIEKAAGRRSTIRLPAPAL